MSFSGTMSIDALQRQALALLQQGRMQEAIPVLRQVLAIAPDNIDALFKLGILLLREGEPGADPRRIAESFACFKRHARLAYADGALAPGAGLPHRLQHDAEQREYLHEQFGTVPPFHLADGGRIDGPVVTVGNVAEAVRQWRESRPQVIVIDDLLTPAALEKLRRFCWGSTIWRDTHPEGYLTAMPEHGLACPLIAQIDEELRQVYAEIMEGHHLRYLWGFKYDSSLRGVGTHADPSLVTFNFWITPDEANLEPDRGGLTVWDVAAPDNWKQPQYIGDTAGCQAYLKQKGAKSITVPYRSNRAMVFASHLFHETDQFHFKPGYTNRRINLTMLYGKRRPK
jgi:TPR repeat